MLARFTLLEEQNNSFFQKESAMSTCQTAINNTVFAASAAKAADKNEAKAAKNAQPRTEKKPALASAFDAFGRGWGRR